MKIAFTLDTAAWIRDEHLVYAQLRGAPFMPRMFGWHDDGERPVLALEDLSGASWPPPWDGEKVDAVLACLAEVAATPPTPELPEVAHGQFDRDGWPEIERDPEPFLRLGLCSGDWLRETLPVLVQAASVAPIAGEALVHMDVRSDNICVRKSRAVLIDWNFACVGNPRFDIAS